MQTNISTESLRELLDTVSSYQASTSMLGALEGYFSARLNPLYQIPENEILVKEIFQHLFQTIRQEKGVL